LVIALFTGNVSAQESFVLQIIHVETDTMLYECPVSSDDHFYLDYIHSSAKTPVQDIFTVGEGGEMILIEENFSWFGAGLEAGSTEDVKVVYDGKHKKIRVLQYRHFPHFLLRVGRIANHRITCHEKSVPLKRLTEGGELVHIRIVPYTVTGH
jgi:hypothetical protein